MNLAVTGKKNTIKGDVGQIVNGNSTQGPTMSNVMNVTINDKDVQYLTTFQRERITKQVKEYAALSGLETLEIYKDLLIIGGAKKMNLFPMDKYKEASDWLDRMIASAQNEIDRKTKPSIKVQAATSAACSKCKELSTTLTHSRTKTNILLALLAASLVMQAWMYLTSDKAIAGTDAVSIDKKCHNDGKVYSIGSTVRMIDGSVKQCIGSASSDSMWETPIKAKR
ncbi:hypothetical protein [Undibacterium danionis]